MSAVCKFCSQDVRLDGGSWVDASDGDCCSGDDELVNENEPHAVDDRAALALAMAVFNLIRFLAGERPS